MGVERGYWRGWPGTVAVALVAVAALAAPAPAPAAGEPQPPTAAEVERRTQDFLDERGPRVTRRADGGIGIEPPEDGRALLAADGIAVALYGAPQLTLTAVGKRSPRGAARKLRSQAAAYAGQGAGRVSRSLNLIGTIATASPGPDGKYRTRQPNAVIRTYLRAARSVSARLTLDIQPARSPVMRELRALRRWIRLPDVDVGIDPEWNVGPRGVPGRDEGSITGQELNRASAWIERLVARKALPPKAMIVHQFREGSIRGRRRIERRAGAQVLLNFDGIGSRRAKRAGYENLASRFLFNGFSLFYDRDTDLFSPRGVLRLRPPAAYAMYQ